jgi:hypothetical protein
MSSKHVLFTTVSLALLTGALGLLLRATAGQGQNPVQPGSPHDAIAAAQTPQKVPVERVEQKKTDHDRSDIFTQKRALPATEALANQPEGGGILPSSNSARSTSTATRSTR